MGQGTLSRLLKRGKENIRLLVLGMENAGKTTFLYMLEKDVDVTIPTIGMTLERVDHMNLSITAFDVGGRCPIRPLQRHFYKDADAVVFMVNSAESADWYLEQVRDEFRRLTEEESLQGVPMAVLANKQDLPGAMTPLQVSQALRLDQVKHNGLTVEVFPTVLTEKQGVRDAMEWIQRRLNLGEVHEAVVKPVEKSLPPSLTTFLKQALTSAKQKLRFSPAA